MFPLLVLCLSEDKLFTYCTLSTYSVKHVLSTHLWGYTLIMTPVPCLYDILY